MPSISKKVLWRAVKLPKDRLYASVFQDDDDAEDESLGTTRVVDDQRLILGVITDGDLRRLMESKKDLNAVTAGGLMHKNPKHVLRENMATKALQYMEEHSITCVVVSEDGKQIDGIIHLHDLLKSGIL